MKFVPLLALAISVLSAQPAFEVASVKPTSETTRTIGMYTYPGGRIKCERLTLQVLIEEAFDVQPFQVSGGPGWVREERYDIDARPPASSKASTLNASSIKLPPTAEQRLMLQSLLAERFALQFHRETK